MSVVHGEKFSIPQQSTFTFEFRSMKTFSLCCVGFLVGAAAAFVTQTPVLETLGYAPKSTSSESSTQLAANDKTDIMDAKEKFAQRETGKQTEVTHQLSIRPTSVANDSSAAKKPTGSMTKTEAVAKPADAKSEIAGRTAPKKITNKYVARRPQNAGSGTVASSKAPSIKSEMSQSTMSKSEMKPEAGKAEMKKPAATKRVVVAKPPMRDIEPNKDVAPKTSKPANPLAGKWQVINASFADKMMSPKQTKSMALEFVDEKIIIKQGDKLETGKFEIGKVRQTEDQVVTELEIKSARKNGPTIKGFYYVGAGKLTMVWGAPGAKRPNPNVDAEIKAARTFKLKPSMQ